MLSGAPHWALCWLTLPASGSVNCPSHLSLWCRPSGGPLTDFQLSLTPGMPGPQALQAQCVYCLAHPPHCPHHRWLLLQLSALSCFLAPPCPCCPVRNWESSLTMPSPCLSLSPSHLVLMVLTPKHPLHLPHTPQTALLSPSPSHPHHCNSLLTGLPDLAVSLSGAPALQL